MLLRFHLRVRAARVVGDREDRVIRLWHHTAFGANVGAELRDVVTHWTAVTGIWGRGGVWG